jgi:hypothetical protein
MALPAVGAAARAAAALVKAYKTYKRTKSATKQTKNYMKDKKADHIRIRKQVQKDKNYPKNVKKPNEMPQAKKTGADKVVVNLKQKRKIKRNR